MEYDYAPVMRLYESLKAKGLKNEADAVLADVAGRYPEGTSAPPRIMQEGLERILERHESSSLSNPHTNSGITRARPTGGNDAYVALAFILLGMFYL